MVKLQKSVRKLSYKKKYLNLLSNIENQNTKIKRMLVVVLARLHFNKNIDEKQKEKLQMCIKLLAVKYFMNKELIN